MWVWGCTPASGWCWCCMHCRRWRGDCGRLVSLVAIPAVNSSPLICAIEWATTAGPMAAPGFDVYSALWIQSECVSRFQLAIDNMGRAGGIAGAAGVAAGGRGAGFAAGVHGGQLGRRVGFFAFVRRCQGVGFAGLFDHCGRGGAGDQLGDLIGNMARNRAQGGAGQRADDGDGLRLVGGQIGRVNGLLDRFKVNVAAFVEGAGVEVGAQVVGQNVRGVSAVVEVGKGFDIFRSAHAWCEFRVTARNAGNPARWGA